ncbi:MAG: NADH-quinone oxidoreductase subunit NuoK [Stackebrandtia sp.]
MHPVIPYVLAGLLFGVGVYGVLTRRNAVLMLAAVELMLGAVNLVLVTADATLAASLGIETHTGQSFALFVIVVAAAEIGVGLAIVLHLYRLRGSIDTDGVDAVGPDDETEELDEAERAAPSAETRAR